MIGSGESSRNERSEADRMSETNVKPTECEAVYGLGRNGINNFNFFIGEN